MKVSSGAARKTGNKREESPPVSLAGGILLPGGSMPPRRVRDRVSARIGMPTTGTAARESSGNWERTALEVRRVRALTSRDALRGATEGEVGRGSTKRRGGIEGRIKELLPHRRRKDSLPPSGIGTIQLLTSYRG
ncbi:hypothetical protein NDU88_001467 [Pleurodeles waltl]|uniref:Uncharacterized protein n=1 Tax=Pleurodeles waltl TaxID=8319 RepID=A0AAV7MKK8_PLEWA|nr:hypothetical protein NDU88_001467 [Pleurodeles waltl]